MLSRLKECAPAGRKSHHVIDWPGLRPGFVSKGRDDVSWVVYVSGLVFP